MNLMAGDLCLAGTKRGGEKSALPLFPSSQPPTPFEVYYTSYIICSINPLSPKSDQHQISPCNINAL